MARVAEYPHPGFQRLLQERTRLTFFFSSPLDWMYVLFSSLFISITEKNGQLTNKQIKTYHTVKKEGRGR
jgi:hypothetical protein